MTKQLNPLIVTTVEIIDGPKPTLPLFFEYDSELSQTEQTLFCLYQYGMATRQFEIPFTKLVRVYEDLGIIDTNGKLFEGQRGYYTRLFFEETEVNGEINSGYRKIYLKDLFYWLYSSEDLRQIAEHVEASNDYNEFVRDVDELELVNL